MSVNEAVKRIVGRDLTPGFYMGVKDKTVDTRSSFWRDFMFPRSQDIIHDKPFMFWDEFRQMYPTLMPTDIDPCNEGDYIATNEAYERVMVSQAYWWLGFPVDCNFEQFLKPGENPYNSRSFAESIQDYMLDLREKLFEGFNQKEEYWAVMMATQGKIEIRPKGGKPYNLRFERDKKLNHVITDPECQWCFDPKKTKLESVKASPWNDMKMMNDRLFDLNRGKTDLIIANRQTCNWFRNCVNAWAFQCKEAGIPFMEVMLPTAFRAAGLEMPEPYDGAEVEFFVAFGSRLVPFYCVETSFQFCDPDTGAPVDINPVKDGKVYGYNRSATRNNTFGGRFSYGKIHNFNADMNAQARYFDQHVTPNGKSMKYHGESAPAALIECPNASWELDVCGGKAPK